MPLGNCNHYVAKTLFLVWPLGGALKTLKTQKKLTQPVLFKVSFLQDASEHCFFTHSNCPVFYTVYVSTSFMVAGSYCDAPVTLKSC